MPKVVKVGERYRVLFKPSGQRGKRKARFFRSQADAKLFAWTCSSARDETAVKLMALGPEDRARILRALEITGSATELEAVASAWGRTRAPLSQPLSSAIAECIAAKRTAGRSREYLHSLAFALRSFAKDHGKRPVSDLTVQEIEAWLNSNGWNATSRITFLQRLITFWDWAIKDGYAKTNVAANVERPSPEASPISVLSVRDAERLLRTCQRVDVKLLPYVAIGLFAGIRPDEIKRLRPESIKNGWIEIQAAKSKTRRRRLVEIHATLKAWLDVPGGVIGWNDWRRRFERVRSAVVVGECGPELPIAWTPDVMRHSFASYAYPLKGAQWTANECGHSEQMLFRCYRELVPREEAEKFWRIIPPANTAPQAA